MPGILVSHSVGNSNVRALIHFWHREGLLHSYYTTLGLSSQARWPHLLPVKWQSQLRRRTYDLPSHLLKTRPAREIIRQLRRDHGGQTLLRQHSDRFSIDAVCRDLDHWVAHRLRHLQSPPEMVYAYEDTARETFAVARKMGLRRIYEITIGHHAAAQKILREEAELMPEFAASLEALRDSPEKLRQKDEELAQADILVASSDFVRETLVQAGIPGEKVFVTQFGAPLAGFAEAPKPFLPSRPLRLLFAGRIGQRKGVGYLLKAMQQLNRTDVELVMLGELVGGAAMYAPYSSWFRHEPPRPHSEVLSLMRECDLLVLPTLFEGQALVILEAMTCGLPVITTPHSGAASLIRDGREGFIIPIRSISSLVEKITWAAGHREEVQAMGCAARARAGEFTWEDYAQSVTTAIGVR